ncbi:MAG: hypothetical protein GVY26_09400 [Bacteroidetes bacterium]|jgi:hypothetical protein|nr:hypothetical protein [Bacteroidota bacterium]
MLYSLVLALLLASSTPSIPLVKDYGQALSIAQQSGRPVFLLFTGLSCPHNEAIPASAAAVWNAASRV